MRRWALWLAWLVPLLVYLLSAYRDVGYWDVGEMDTVPWILGIAHPTGFPGYVLLGWLFTHAFPLGSVAFRMSLLSALAMSATAWLIARTVDDEYDAPWIALACALLFAFGDIVWARATRAEVHAPLTAAIAATLLLMLRWHRAQNGRMLLAAAACWGLAIAIHPVAILIAPGVALLLLRHARALRLRTLAAAAAIALAIVAGCYAYLPLRSAYVSAQGLDPTRALGLPAGQAFWDYDHPASAAGFVALATGLGFDVNSGLSGLVTPERYPQRAGAYLAQLFSEFTPLGGALVLVGLAAAFVRDRTRAAALVLCCVGSALFALGYNEEADIQRYLLASFVVAALFAGDAAAWIVANARPCRALVPAAMIAVAAFSMWSGRHLFEQPRDARAVRDADAILRVTPSNAVVIATWTYATPLAYRAYVAGGIGSRTLVAAWVNDEGPYLRSWVARRPVFVVGPPDPDLAGVRFRQVLAAPSVYRVSVR